MILATIVALLVGLFASFICARVLYRLSARKGYLRKRSDFTFNAILVGGMFFCITTFVYVVMLLLL